MFPIELEDRYELIRPLGEGGYGSVYLVKDRRLGRELALKVLDGVAADPAQAERFRREARVTSQLQHPNVVKVFDHGDLPEGRAFIGYEYVAGHDLAAVLERREAVPLAQLLTWIQAIAGALEEAHEKGITHRDLKPANILVRADGQALLCDFGVARLAASHTVQTREGLILGTPSYVAPEVWFGAAPGPSGDQFALAVTLYELLYRERPFPSDEPTEIWQALKAGWRPAIPVAHAGEHPVLERTLLRALSPRPEERYASVGEFGHALGRTEGTQGFQALESSASARATRVLTAPREEVTEAGGMTRRTMRPGITRTQALAPAQKAGAAAGVVAVLLAVAWLAWPGAGPADPGPAPAAAAPPWTEALTRLEEARRRLPDILQVPPGGRMRQHVQSSLRELVDARVELALNRYLEAQVAWLQALEKASGWGDPAVQAPLVREVLAPTAGIATVFATLQYYGGHFVSNALDLEESGLSRGDFVSAMLGQKKRLLERLGTHDTALEEVTATPPRAVQMSRSFLILYFLSDFRHPRAEGHDRVRFVAEALAWLDQLPGEDPEAQYALALVSWLAIRAAYMGHDCPQRLDLGRRLHARALAAEGSATIPLETSLQALVRASMVLSRVQSHCEGEASPQNWALVDEGLDVLAAHAEEHPRIVEDLAFEMLDLLHGAGWGGPREKSPELEARIERLRALRAQASG